MAGENISGIITAAATAGGFLFGIYSWRITRNEKEQQNINERKTALFQLKNHFDRCLALFNQQYDLVKKLFKEDDDSEILLQQVPLYKLNSSAKVIDELKVVEKNRNYYILYLLGKESSGKREKEEIITAYENFFQDVKYFFQLTDKFKFDGTENINTQDISLNQYEDQIKETELWARLEKEAEKRELMNHDFKAYMTLYRNVISEEAEALSKYIEAGVNSDSESGAGGD